MNSFKKSFLFACVKVSGFIFMVLPMGVSLWMGRVLGAMGYYLLARKRRVVYANLKTVFSQDYSPSQLETMTRQVFINFIQSAVELLCLPKVKRIGFDKFVELEGREHLEAASAQGKGIILLAIHSGSWELASVVGGVTKGPYHVVANDQSKIPQLDKMLNEYRTIAGAHVILAGVATKEIVRAMQNNEVVSLVLDQGGRHGLVVPFLGKSASMSTGAMRLAFKYGSAVCPVWIERRGNGRHHLKVFPSLDLSPSGDLEEDIRKNVLKAAGLFEGLLKQHPTEYMWFYKVFKYSNQSHITILDDGRTGHLRQSQSISSHLKQVLKKKGKIVSENTVLLDWRGEWVSSLFSFYAWIAQFLPLLRKESILKYFLTASSLKDLMKKKSDFVVSCGSQAAGVNYILSQGHLAKSIAILTPGIVDPERFDVIVMPEHDQPQKLKRARLITPRVSPNLVNPSYLKEQREGLTLRYSHLKDSVRKKFGVLIGGNTDNITFDEAQVHELIDQIKEASRHYNADILLTTSRRTPAAIENIFIKELKNFDRCTLCIIANQRNVPEAVGGILALSDLIIVSGESISMVSEAISSGKKTIVFSPSGPYLDKPRNKYEEFVLKLDDQGYLMTTSVYDIKAKITQLLSFKITLKMLDDQNLIQNALEACV